MAAEIGVGQIQGYKDAFFEKMWQINLIFENNNKVMHENLEIDNIKSGTLELMFCSFETERVTDTGGGRGTYTNGDATISETDIEGDRISNEKQFLLHLSTYSFL